MHAMSSSVLSKSAAEEKMNEFIAEKMDVYRSKLSASRSFRDSGNAGYAAVLERDAYVALGEAMHPIMDSTSPSHSGFKEWNTTDFNSHGGFPGTLESKSDLLDNPDLLDETIKRMQGAFN